MLASWVKKGTIIVCCSCLVPVPISLAALFVLPINHPAGRVLLGVMGLSALALTAWIGVLVTQALICAVESGSLGWPQSNATDS